MMGEHFIEVIDDKQEQHDLALIRAGRDAGIEWLLDTLRAYGEYQAVQVIVHANNPLPPVLEDILAKFNTEG